MDRPGRSLRVVMLVENNPYPFEPTVRPHAEALANAGYQVTVIAPRGKKQAAREVIRGVRVYRFPMPDIGAKAVSYIVEFVYATLIMSLLTLWVWMRHGLDVLHLYNPPDTLWVAGLLPKLFRKKVIYDLRDLAPEIYESKFNRRDIFYRVLVWLERRSCFFADHVVVVNESYRKMVIERAGVPPERVSVVRLGPELARVRLVPPDPELRARAGKIIVYLGKMAEQDGVDHLLRALNHLKNGLGYQDWYAVFIGKADDPQRLSSLAADLDISDRVWFAGFVPDDKMFSYLSAADVCVDPDPANPLNNISTMTKLMEYMAIGKPVVAYDLTEHRVTAAESVLYARPNDELDMACQIARLLEDPTLGAQLGAIGRERIVQGLSWDHQQKRLLAVYEQMGKTSPYN